MSAAGKSSGVLAGQVWSQKYRARFVRVVRVYPRQGTADRRKISIAIRSVVPGAGAWVVAPRSRPSFTTVDRLLAEFQNHGMGEVRS